MHHRPMKMKNTSIRLGKEQIEGLKSEAKKLAKKTRMKCDWSAVLRIAVDDFLSRQSKAKA